MSFWMGIAVSCINHKKVKQSFNGFKQRVEQRSAKCRTQSAEHAPQASILFQALDIHHSEATLQLPGHGSRIKATGHSRYIRFGCKMMPTHCGSELNSHNLNFRPYEYRLVSSVQGIVRKEEVSTSSNAKDK